MAYDNLFSQYLKPVKSVMDYNAEFDAANARKQDLQQNALTLAANQRKADESVQSGQRQAQLRQAMLGLGADATDEDRVKVMRGTASPEGFAAADALEKSLVDRKKGLAAANKDEADTKHKELTRDIALHDFHAQKLAQVQTLEQALAWAQEGQTLGLFNQPGQYERGIAAIQQAATNPQAFEQWRQRALQGGQSATEQLKAQAAAAKQAEEVRQFGVTDSRIKTEGAANRGVQIRGQDMVDRRAKDGLGVGGKPPAGYRFNEDGTLSAIPGGPADKAANASEGERKAATLLKRLEFSEKQLDDVVTKAPAAAKPSVLANTLRRAGMEDAANTMTSSDRQRVDAAQLDILDAALTLGTGAAYTKEQLEGYRKSYFPQLGDTPANVADKKARLQNVIEAAKVQAGRAAKSVEPKKPGAPDPAPKPAGKPSLKDIFGN